jgi:hypothetical protein
MTVSGTAAKPYGTHDGGRWVYRFSRTVSDLVLRPGVFFEAPEDSQRYLPPLAFLLLVCVIFTALAALILDQKRALHVLILFLNGVSLPFVIAFLLYLVAWVLCPKTFHYHSLFAITSYANVTLLIAWIPGLEWMTGIWKFYLIGLGITKQGQVSGVKAFACILVAAAALLLLIQLLIPVMKQS